MSFLYLNPGYGNLFDEVSQTSYTQATDSSAATGIRFSLCGKRSVKLPTPLNEIWARYDVLATREWGDTKFGIVSSTKEAAVAMKNNEYNFYIQLHGSDVVSYVLDIKVWHNVLIHVKSGVSDEVYEVWINGMLKHSFTGNVLDGEPIQEFYAFSNNAQKHFSQIIVSDTRIKWTEKIIAIPTSISATMADNGDGTYSASNSGEYVKQTIDRDALRNLCTDDTVITGICIVGRGAYCDGGEIDTMQAIEGDTVLGECLLDGSQNTSIFCGKHVNMPISTVSGTYGWKAK